MIILRIALRYLLRRKVRMASIGALVFIGTMVIVLGDSFSLSAKRFSREAIINYFTGDVIIYSERSKEKPSPFAFTTPLPILARPALIESWLSKNNLVASHVAIGQNYGQLSIEKNGKKTDVPFFFYAVDPVRYAATFPNINMIKGTFFNTIPNGKTAGVVLSQFQVDNYAKNYNVEIATDDTIKLLSLTEGGSVNAATSTVVGVYQPKRYVNVFNYINFLDITTYSQLYNFTGVDASSLPDGYNSALSMNSDDDIFGLSDKKDFGKLDTRELISQELSGYSIIAVKLKDHENAPAFIRAIESQGFGVKVATWVDASSFFANVASIIQSVIYGSTFLIFLIVVFILANTLIISVLERTGEIGTLRAMGAEKSFIRAIFLWESLLLNGSAALAGMLVSALILVIVGQGSGIVLPDVMSQYLVGGGPLPIVLAVRPFAEAGVLIVVVSVLSTLYPIRVATAISPLKAMSDL